jgi:hypothetical protein
MESFDLDTWTNFIGAVLVQGFTRRELSESYGLPPGLTGDDADRMTQSSVCLCQRLVIKFFEMSIIKQMTELLHFPPEIEASLTTIHDECLRSFCNLSRREEQAKEPVGRGQHTLACEAKAAKKEAKRNNKTMFFILMPSTRSSLVHSTRSSVFSPVKINATLESRHENNVPSLWVLFCVFLHSRLLC